MPSLITARIDSVWKPIPKWGRLSLTLEFEEDPFHSKHLLELLDQEDGVMKRATSRVVKHSPIWQGAMSPTHEGKVA
jgi:hypothetical protein